MSKVLFMVLIQLFSIEVVRVTCNNLTISYISERVRITTYPQSVSFTCAADVILTGCQFKWFNGHANNSGPLLDLSQGSRTQVDPANLDDGLTGYSYSGRGLGAGVCGVTLQVKGWKQWMVACRVRSVSGGWTYSWVDLYAENWAPFPHNMTTPREVVVLPGGEARFSLRAQQPIRACTFYLSSVPRMHDFNDGDEYNHTGRKRYIGAGLQSGECGLALTNVSEADNGLVRCSLLTTKRMAAYRFMVLIVAHPPIAPTLSLTYMDTNVTAICEVKDGRPVAKISWVLGDDIIRQDEDDDTQADVQDEWRWPWMQGSIQQTLTLQLNPQYIGKDLTCRVSHVALTQPLEAKMTIAPA